MANKRKNKLKKPNVQMTPKEREAKEELKEATSDFKAKITTLKSKPAIAILLDIFKIMLVLLILDFAIVMVPTATNFIGGALGINSESSSNDMVMWQACCMFAVLCDFHIMLFFLKKIMGSLSFRKSHNKGAE